MKRVFVLFATALLLLTVAAPTAAAPDLDKNKNLNEIEVDCEGSTPVDLGIITVKAKSVPGWRIDLDSAKTPIQYRASMIELFEDDVSQWKFYDAPPRGLEPKLVGPCEFSYEWDWEGFHYKVEQTEAYFTLPRPWE